MSTIEAGRELNGLDVESLRVQAAQEYVTLADADLQMVFGNVHNTLQESRSDEQIYRGTGNEAALEATQVEAEELEARLSALQAIAADRGLELSVPKVDQQETAQQKTTAVSLGLGWRIIQERTQRPDGSFVTVYGYQPSIYSAKY